MEQATKSEIDYTSIKGWLGGDLEVEELRENLKLTKLSLDGLVSRANSALVTRMAAIVVNAGFGYYGKGISHQKSISSKFPNHKYTLARRESNEVSVIDYKSGEEEHTVYYSRPLGIWVVGEPEQREDGLYCQITGEKISK